MIIEYLDLYGNLFLALKTIDSIRVWFLGIGYLKPWNMGIKMGMSGPHSMLGQILRGSSLNVIQRVSALLYP